MAKQHSVKRSRRFETDICREYWLEEDILDSFSKVNIYSSVLLTTLTVH